MKRRTVIAGLAAAGVLAWLGKPRDRGAPHDAYFQRLNALLKREGPPYPCLVLDLDRLDQNLDALKSGLHPTKHHRVVAKSLPSPRLLEHVMASTGSRRLMAFHQPFLNLQARDFPDADILLGKPMPVRAAQRFYEQHQGPFDPARQLQWLIDSPQRLAQYLALAQGRSLRVNVNIEINVGLNRGGVEAPAELVEMARVIAANPQHLRFSGFMGYDPHVVKMPSLFGSPHRLQAQVNQRYRALIDTLRREQPELVQGELTWNGAGSPNYVLHDEHSPLNDIAVGSALVQPTDFDLPTLDAHRPALFIATPVLKAGSGTRLPKLEKASPLIAWWDPNRRHTYFIYGGRWMARFESPRGLRLNGVYGYSSNQEFVNASHAAQLAVDDYVFLRPTQSEALMLQFGDLVVVREARVIDRWSVFGAGAELA
jgi:D-serine deaminase-like pyridoxal phosphate-dependent protein